MRADDLGPPEPGVRIVRAGQRVSVGRVELTTEDGGGESLHEALPPDLPLGYHRLIDHDTGHTTRLIVSPGRCHLPADLRIWGWAVQTYAMRSSGSWGIGDFGDLARFARWATQTGAGAVLVNPLHATDPYPLEDSPYYPGSRTRLNPLYVRIEDVPGAAAARSEIDQLGAAGRALNRARLIDRAAVFPLKMQALELLWDSFTGSGDFDRFRASGGPSLVRYATFVALTEKYGADWRQWPSELQHPDSPATERASDVNRVHFQMWVQWLLDRQLALAAEPPAMLINDLAVGVNPDGADAWLFSHAIADGVTIGAPPDDFNLRGQGWGLAAFDPWRLRAAGYEPFIQMVRSAFRHGGGLRYDHVMGLFRLFWIPQGAPPEDGAYVRYPHSDLLDILALESHRAQAIVVGEDLGTVEPGIREQLLSHNVLSYRLAYFESGDPSTYPECALAGITNHDLPTLAGLLSGADLEDQRTAGVVPNESFAAAAVAKVRRIAAVGPEAPREEVVRECHRAIARCPSRIVAATLEDALGVDERPNLPGTTSERPNWRLALPFPLEEVESHPGPRALAEIMGAERPLG
jgi:4-alpha-glucanotransferase